jgi:hypothetical protein
LGGGLHARRANRYSALDRNGDGQLDRAELVARLAGPEGGRLLLTDLELDALVAAADRGPSGGGDGTVSRAEWRRLVLGQGGGGEGSGDEGSGDSNDDSGGGGSTHGSAFASHGALATPVTSSMFCAFAWRDLRCDLSAGDLELCFATLCASQGSGASVAAAKGPLATLGKVGGVAVDRAMATDFGRFHGFLGLLRAKVKREGKHRRKREKFERAMGR